MSIISEYIKRIALYIVTMEFIIIAVPENSYRKYVKFITGMILVIIVLEPIYKLFEVLK